MLSRPGTIELPSETSPPAPGRAGADGGIAPVVSWAVTIVPIAIGLAVAVAIAVASWQGFDFTDEGLSLLSARHPEAAFRSFSGAQVFIGPVFDLVGHRVGLLRLVKLLAVLAAGGFLGWAVQRWSSARAAAATDGGPAGRVGWRSPWPVVVGLGSLMVYSWTGLSPGYNDVAVLMTTLSAGLTLLIVVEPSRRRWPLVLGAVHFCHLVSKWPSAVLVGALVWIALVVILHDWRVLARLVMLTAAGLLAAAIFTHLFLADLRQLVPAMLEANQVVSESANQPGNLWTIYVDDLHRLIDQLAGRLWWVVPTAIAIGVAERAAGRGAGRRARGWRWVAAVLAGVAAVGLGLSLARAGIVHGGSANVEGLRQVLPSCLVFALAVPIVAFIARPRDGAAGRAPRSHALALPVLALLVLLPLAQAVGTGNSFTRIATMASAPWVAVLVLCAIEDRQQPLSGRILGLGAVAVAVVSVAAVAHSGQYDHPYRLATPRSGQTTYVDGVVPLRGIRVDPAQAQFLTELRDLYERSEPRPDQRLFSMWSVPGLTFALGAVQPGDGWLAASSPERVADTIGTACDTDPRLRAGELPFVLVSEPELPANVAEALGRCGAPFPECYEEAGSVQMPPGSHAGVPITLWVPAGNPC